MTRNENLNLEIGWASKVPDNHCHTSPRHINLWQEAALQKAKIWDKSSCRKGVPHAGLERMAPLTGLSWVTATGAHYAEAVIKRYHLPPSPKWKYLEATICMRGAGAAASLQSSWDPCWLLGISVSSSQITHTPCPQHRLCSAEVRGLGEKTLSPQRLLH